MPKKEKFLFIVNKYIMAESAMEAIEKEKDGIIFDVVVDPSYRNAKIEKFVGEEKGVGFGL